MENMENKEVRTQTMWVFDKKVKEYQDSVDNYVIPRELTVTITLAEYRRLLVGALEAKAEKLQFNVWDLERKVKDLEQKLKDSEERYQNLCLSMVATEEQQVKA